MKAVKRPRDSSGKILERKKLARLLVGCGKKSKPLVFTNGCFDLLHPGHISTLERARKLGDSLVVALNTDESVRSLGKGDDRPVNPLASRLAVMAALECVDYVTWFGETTPLETILLLKPDFIVKGGDWQPAQIVGSREARKWGGRTKSLPYLKGHSTTVTLQKINKIYG